MAQPKLTILDADPRAFDRHFEALEAQIEEEREAAIMRAVVDAIKPDWCRFCGGNGWRFDPFISSEDIPCDVCEGTGEAA